MPAMNKATEATVSTAVTEIDAVIVSANVYSNRCERTRAYFDPSNRGRVPPGCSGKHDVPHAFKEFPCPLS